jgi:hypothetical protein
MRTLWIATVTCGLAWCLPGCDDMPPPPGTKPTASKAVDETKLAEAKKQYAAFIEEATKGADVLESQPNKDAIEQAVKKVRAALDEASHVYPNHAKMDKLDKTGRRMMPFFEACRTNAAYQSANKNATPEDIQKHIAEACEGNASCIRQLIEMMKEQMGPSEPVQK